MRRIRRRVAVAAAATAMATVLSGATAVGASPETADTTPMSLGFLPTELSPAGSVPVTLITGDRVDVGIDSDGVPVVRDVTAAARPDGAAIGFTTLQRGSDVYVVPEDALPLVGDLLDWELFNLAKLADLVAYGMVDEVPVIVRQSGTPTGRAMSATALPGTTTGAVLSSIDAVSMTVDGDGQWWWAVRSGADAARAGAGIARGMATAVAGSGIEKVWLNELLHIALDESVPQIGAPVAWADGLDGTGTTVAVLDTGVDATHPDLAGKVVTRMDFTGSSPNAVDGHGHGTHVAATIAGTGAASDGSRRGVAPGADLMIGKVCNNGGQCPADAIIAGMQWAAFSGADVVNMSLGGPATDGTDPLSTSLNNLSRATGVLFVVAAGNSGPAERTVGTPGVADEALTVAAVDKADLMATFSSRGPRLGDDAPKPDIAAPGVAIVAARAAGTAMGTPVDDFYTTASGTSMATPHVAGAAAIAAQLHPTLAGAQIKALLTNTARDLGHDVFAQGSGLVDLGRAVDPAIFPDGQVTFGRLVHPHDTPRTGTITYTNVSDEDITLVLDASLTSQVGPAPAPDGMVSLDPTTLTVPAGGTAQATVTLDGSVLGEVGPFGPYRGEVTATDDTGDLRGVSRISAFLEPERFEVTVEVTPPDGATGVIPTNVLITPMDDQVLVHDAPLSLPSGAATARLFPGSYAVTTQVRWRDADGRQHTALPVAPQVDVSGPTTVRFDLREAEPVRFDTPDQAEVFHATFGYRRVSQTGFWSVSSRLEGDYRSRPSWWALPTDQVTVGAFGAAHTAVLAAPMLRMTLVGGGPPVTVHPRYADVSYSVPAGSQQWTENGRQVSRAVRAPLPRLTGDGTHPVVYARLGTPDHLDAVNVDGAVVLMTATDICTDACDFPALRERVDDAAARGAVGVVVAAATGHTFVGTPPAPVVVCADGPDSCPPVPPYAAIPVLSIPADEAVALIDRLGRPGAHRFQYHGEALPPHLNLVIDRFPGRLPDDLSSEVRSSDNRRIVHRVHADEPGEAGMEWFPATPAAAEGHQAAAFGASGLMRLPGVPTRTVVTTLLGVDTAEMVHLFRVASHEYAAPSVLDPASNLVESREFLLDSPVTRTVSWNARPFVPGAAVVPAGTAPGNLSVQPCAGCRQDDTFYPILFQTTGDGARTQVMGLLNNQSLLPGMTLPLFMFGLSGCEPPECEIHLFDAAGEEIPQVLLTTGFSLGSGQSGKETNR